MQRVAKIVRDGAHDEALVLEFPNGDRVRFQSSMNAEQFVVTRGDMTSTIRTVETSVRKELVPPFLDLYWRYSVKPGLVAARSGRSVLDGLAKDYLLPGIDDCERDRSTEADPLSAQELLALNITRYYGRVTALLPNLTERDFTTACRAIGARSLKGVSYLAKVSVLTSRRGHFLLPGVAEVNAALNEELDGCSTPQRITKLLIQCGLLDGVEPR